MKFTSVRAGCAEVAELDVHFHQMDAKPDFLNRKINQELYIEIPEVVDTDEKDIKHLAVATIEEVKNMDLVCKLEKSIHGTKQAPSCWNMKINSVLSGDLCFEQSEGHPCINVQHEADGVMMTALYVDDLILSEKSSSQILWMQHMFNGRFEMKDPGEARLFLGLEITRDRK